MAAAAAAATPAAAAAAATAIAAAAAADTMTVAVEGTEERPAEGGATAAVPASQPSTKAEATLPTVAAGPGAGAATSRHSDFGNSQAPQQKRT